MCMHILHETAYHICCKLPFFTNFCCRSSSVMSVCMSETINRIRSFQSVCVCVCVCACVWCMHAHMYTWQNIQRRSKKTKKDSQHAEIYKETLYLTLYYVILLHYNFYSCLFLLSNLQMKLNAKVQLGLQAAFGWMTILCWFAIVHSWRSVDSSAAV